jgi:hypothetical protein
VISSLFVEDSVSASSENAAPVTHMQGCTRKTTQVHGYTHMSKATHVQGDTRPRPRFATATDLSACAGSVKLHGS